MHPSNFNSSLTITHIGTATAIVDINGVKFLTDPFFSPAGSEWDLGIAVLKNTEAPALGLENLPPINAILLSHEDHPDNLDELGRRLLDGRHVLTTVNGAKKLAPVLAFAAYSRGKKFEITGTPCQHVPGGECTGFILTTKEFGASSDGRPNAIYFSGDTVYIEELAKISEKWHVTAAILNLRNAQAPLPDGPLQITMDGKQGARLFRELKADVLVHMHFESWGHFTQFGDELKAVLTEEGVNIKCIGLSLAKHRRSCK
ncbi:hypothetical protein AJ79_08568 [Helicocarpus griseus UAMH5409]|uniref:Metallo-beta-lactamase domain-containing protein n=1 Tax=Helicocarpus griseus UAMH5409 TaxID=1447875 RepID=A0A2B7WS45_9EURO|nr:hypothetical protein AJ79_08568 [Helicocarpus griseus UAMH5409]